MGAGASSRKLQAEAKLRAEAERKAQAEETARKRLELELLETKRELDRIRASLGDRGGEQPRGKKIPRWQPCRVNKSLLAGLEPFELERVLVFHDGENCWVPNHADLRFAAVRDALSQIVAALLPAADEEHVLRVMQYSFFLSRDEAHPFHPHINFWNDMDGLGVHLESVGSKKGAVDTKMKMRLGALGAGGGKGTVVLVIAGDRDFMPELTLLCHAGFYVVLLHRNNISNTRVVEECCHAAYDCWEDILACTHPTLSYSTRMVPVPRDVARAVERAARQKLTRGVKVRCCLETEEEDNGGQCFLTVLGSRDVEEACDVLRHLARSMVAERVRVAAEEWQNATGEVEGEGTLLRWLEKESQALVVEDSQDQSGNANGVLAGRRTGGEGGVGEDKEQGEVVLVVSGTAAKVWRAKSLLEKRFPSLTGLTTSTQEQQSPETPGGEGGLGETGSSDEVLAAAPHGAGGHVKAVWAADLEAQAGVRPQARGQQNDCETATVTVTVPAKMVGPRICGPKRSKLLRLEAETGASISIPKPGAHGKDIQVLSLRGSAGQVEAARLRILALVSSPSDDAPASSPTRRTIAAAAQGSGGRTSPPDAAVGS